MTDIFTVSIGDPKPKAMFLVNELGQIIDSWNIDGVKEFTGSAEDYPSGIYHLQLVSESGSSTQKLIIR